MDHGGKPDHGHKQTPEVRNKSREPGGSEDQHLLAFSTVFLIQPRPITLGMTPPTVDSGLSYQCSVLSHRFAVIIIIVIKMMMIPKIVIMMMMIPKELFTE